MGRENESEHEWGFVIESASVSVSRRAGNLCTWSPFAGNSEFDGCEMQVSTSRSKTSSLRIVHPLEVTMQRTAALLGGAKHAKAVAISRILLDRGAGVSSNRRFKHSVKIALLVGIG